MARSPRDLAARLGIDEIGPVRAAYRGAEMARYFARGYRAARHIPAAAQPSQAEHSDGVGDLEQFADAHAQGPGIIKWRHYFDIYERHLARFRGTEVRLVEIGVYGGGSLGLWRTYLGADAHICGIDIDPTCRRFAAERTEVVIGDQGDPDFWRAFLDSHPQIDIVIDDGGHLPQQQAVTLESLLPAMRPGGVYVCEDIHGAFQPFNAFVDGFARPLGDIPGAPDDEPTPVNALQSQIASVHRYPIITVLEKTPRHPGAFECRRYGTEWPDALPSDVQAGTAV